MLFYLAETPRLERGHRLHDGHLSRVLDYHYHMSPNLLISVFSSIYHYAHCKYYHGRFEQLAKSRRELIASPSQCF